MNDIIGLFLTFVVGLFILMGTGIVFVTKNNERFVDFSLSMAFGVMGTLVITELIPESFELISEGSLLSRTLIIIILSLIGILILKTLDIFIPHHEHDHHHKEGNLANLYHIGLVSSIALILHNIIEGMAIYATVISSINLGFLLCIGVGLHNIPMGMVITSTFYKVNNNIKKTLLISFLISISTFIGGIIMYFLKGNLVNEFILGILISVTLGMIIYIALFELLPKMICSKNKKMVFLGFIVGVLTLLISSLF